jgi:predicted nucleic acid-binding protein
MLYLDANVFIYPVLYDGPRAQAAAKLLARVEAGSEPAATCALTFDEVFWVIARYAGRDAALRHASLLLGLPHLRVLPVREVETAIALDLLRQHRKLSPRDAIHAAASINAGIFTIVSDDDDFDEVPALKRQRLA